MKFDNEEEERKYLERLHKYTKYKLVEMLINKYNDKKLQNLNVMEELAEDVLGVLDKVGNRLQILVERVIGGEYNYERSNK